MSCPIFFFNDTATTEIYTLSLHDALPISGYRTGVGTGPITWTHSRARWRTQRPATAEILGPGSSTDHDPAPVRSEEHTSELQSRQYLVCRLLLEKKKKPQSIETIWT